MGKLYKASKYARAIAVAGVLAGNLLALGGGLAKITPSNKRVDLIDNYRQTQIESIIGDDELAQIKRNYYADMPDDKILQDIKNNSNEREKQKLAEIEKLDNTANIVLASGLGVLGGSVFTMMSAFTMLIASDGKDNTPRRETKESNNTPVSLEFEN